jgi:amino acid adenylation domain-containing protein
MTYAELEDGAKRVANLLADLGVRRGDRVGIYMDKSAEAIVAIYGVLAAGAAYVPLDPQAPTARLAYIARDADIRVLVSGQEKAPEWSALVAQGAPLEALVVPNASGAIEPPSGVKFYGAAAVAGAALHDPDLGTVDSDLAYILYTSGSTGTPKGVMLTHRNCLAFVEWAAEEFALSHEDRLSSHAPLHFDLSTFDLFAAALAGAALVLVSPGVSVFPAEVIRFIERNEISVWYSVPSVLTLLVTRGGLEPGGLPQLRTILFAGEVFPTKHLRMLQRLLPHVRLANLYGPTETNVCTWWEVPPLPDDLTDSIPIGKAIPNVDVFAVTEEGLPASVGETGELYVRGPTVMQGYLGDRDQTGARLVPHPFGGELDQLVYRTGDLVEEQDDGNYRFIGRRDAQIKSRGYRIELGDIEAALHAHPAVVEAVVVAVPDELVTNRIKAYVVSRDELSKRDLVGFCAARIPQYMIPEDVEFREALPKTSTGKVDRRALA